MADLELIRLSAAEVAAQTAALTTRLTADGAELAAARQRLAGLQAGGDTAELQAGAERIRELTAARRASTAALGALREEFRTSLDQLLGADLELEGGVPLVLLPVRIEVRSTADQAALRVRLFHDSVHAETLDEGLTDTERAAGIAYWTAVWESGDTQPPWPALVKATSTRRAPWVAEALRPANLAARPATPPDFPPTGLRGATQPVARTLPDRFHIRVEQDGPAARTVVGRAIPDELPVGLTDRDEITAVQIDGEDLPLIDESLRWLVDFAEAERVGMGVTVALPVPGATVRKLTVFGVRASLDPAGGADRIAHLVRSHRFTDGAEFLAQGTPTNNTASVRTEWSKRTPLGPPSLAAAAAQPGDNAAVTAAALGIDPQLLGTLPGAHDREQPRAAAFHTALWTTTWGDAIEHLTDAGRANGDKRLDNPSLDAVRDHWVDHVRGRGPIPALRLGRQPYGVLPLVATGSSYRPLRGGFVENRLVPFIDQQLRWMWNDAVGEVANVMNRPLDTALPEILGTDAVLRGLRVRTALSPDPVIGATGTALSLPDLGSDLTKQQIRALVLKSGVDPTALDAAHHLIGKKTRTLAMPLVHDSDSDFIASLLDADPANRRPQSVLQVLLAHAAAIEKHQRESLAPLEYRDALRQTIVETTTEVDRELLVGALTAVVEGQAFDDPIVAEAARHVDERVGRFDSRLVTDRNPVPALAASTVVQRLAGREPDVQALRGTVGMTLIGEIFHSARRAAAFRTALETIAKIESAAERQLLLSSTLDCCSHRLDAWITATATRRLADLRAGGATGCHLGAYGWLENIELRTPVPAGQVEGRDVVRDAADGGFVHAPGLIHAATAGVLRSGRLTHRRGDPNNEALDIDLSSTRTRDAAALLDGMQRQSLGALLGYRLERRLHEMSGAGTELDRFIYVLRGLAPLRAGKLTEPDQPAQESVAAADVVDGLRLLELSDQTIVDTLAAGPKDPRYIAAGEWRGPVGDEGERVLKAIRELERTHDAVADLLLAESVHQLVAGNTPRAAAVLDVLGAGEAPPPQPEVIRTPRTGIAIQHRLAVVIPDPPPAAAPGWNPTAPRALAEPRLERWAQTALGDPVIGPGETLSGAALAALDVLYDADGDSVGTSTLLTRIPGGDPALLAPVWELAGLLRTAVAAGRPMDVADVGRPVEDDAVGRTVDAAELQARADTAIAAVKDALLQPVPLPGLLGFGIRPPGVASPDPDEAATADRALIAGAAARVVTAEALLAKSVDAASPRSAAELAGQALTAVFGAGFVALPLITAAPAGEADLWAGGAGPGRVPARPGADIRPWLARAGTIRPVTAAYGETVLVREAFGTRPLLRVVQTPVGAFGTWVGLPFPDATPPATPLVSTVVEVAGAAAGDPDPDLTGALAGVVLDEWTEVVPRKVLVDDPRQPEIPPAATELTTTGMAINANAPGARPPQTILLAMSADGADWNADRLVGLLDEAQALARMRTVTLQQIPGAGEFLPALYFRDWSLQGEPTLQWAKLTTEFDVAHAQKFLAVDL